MSKVVWPRLPEAAARALLNDIEGKNPAELRASASLFHPDAAEVEVGGRKVGKSVIENVCHNLRSCADGLGFPEPLNRAAVTRFDRPATRILHDSMRIVVSDAAADGVWSYLSLVALPDLSVWRWPERAPDRLLGRPRNVFRRLWWRGEVIGSDLIDVKGGLGEDELVNIMERTTLAANRKLARAMASAVVGLGETGVARSEVMRDLGRRVLRTQSVLCLDALDSGQVRAVVADALKLSVEALRTDAPASNLVVPSQASHRSCTV